MADGRHDSFNTTPNRGRKLRSQGSNPTGTQTMSFTPEYSGEQDYDNLTDLNQRNRVKPEYHPGDEDSAACCRELGLTCKKPLT